MSAVNNNKNGKRNTDGARKVRMISVFVFGVLIIHANAMLFGSNSYVRHLVLFGFLVLVWREYKSYLQVVKEYGELKSYLSMCAWCKKIRVADSWITIEEYFEQQHNEETTHGICSACVEKELQKLNTK